MFNIRRVDLNLLPVFEAVYEEQSLSRAAVRLAMTQSAVSHAVTRLRTLFRDELFVRQPRGVLPTPTADVVYARIRGALGMVREAVDELQGFNAKTSTRRFFVAIPHPLGPMIALRLRERLARIAPKIDVVVSTRSRPIDLDRALREGRVDYLRGRRSHRRGCVQVAARTVAARGDDSCRRERRRQERRRGQVARPGGGARISGVARGSSRVTEPRDALLLFLRRRLGLRLGLWLGA